MTTESPDDDFKCEIVQKGNVSFLNVGFQGIPEHLLINTFVSLIIVLTFLGLKYIVWTQKRRHISIHQVRWISLFFRDAYSFIEKADLNRANSTYVPLDTVISRVGTTEQTLESGIFDDYEDIAKSMSYYQMLWYIFFKMEENEILKRCGTDAQEYLLFLKICMEYSLINMIVMLLAVLPANFHGDLLSNANAFMKTTIANVDVIDSDFIWIHLISALFLMIVCFMKVRVFSSSLIHYYKDAWAKRTVMMKETGHRPITVERIEKFYKNALPLFEIEDIKLVYKYKRLIHLNKKLKEAEEAVNVCEYISRTEGRPVYVVGRCWFCSYYCRCPFWKKSENGIKYYTEEVKAIKKLMADELSRLPTKILHYAFVTFRCSNMAIRASSIKKDLDEIEDSKYWDVKKAPDPANIIWENLNLESSGISRKTLLINTTVFLVALFVTTPTVVVSSLHLETFLQDVSIHTGNYLIGFLPTVIVWILSLAIPALVIYSSGYLDFETKSELNRSIMFKTVTFLILAVVILPSFGLTSINAFISTNPGNTVRWRCIFLPDNGSFFVGYVMFSAFIGNILQILRPGEIILFFIKMLSAKSEAEKVPMRKTCIWDFNYGVQYSHAIMTFVLVLFYSLLVPLISPFGLLYFFFKYVVDRYNIYFSYRPTRTSYAVHTLAIHFMFFALIMKNIGLFVLLYIRSGWNTPTYIAQAIALLSIVICISSINPCNVQFLPSWILMPHDSSERKYRDYTLEDVVEDRKMYHPFVLQKYLSVICSVDKYDNPIPTDNGIPLERQESNISVEDEGFCGRD